MLKRDVIEKYAKRRHGGQLIKDAGLVVQNMALEKLQLKMELKAAMQFANKPQIVMNLAFPIMTTMMCVLYSQLDVMNILKTATGQDIPPEHALEVLEVKKSQPI